jgi:hypothetical protein
MTFDERMAHWGETLNAQIAEAEAELRSLQSLDSAGQVDPTSRSAGSRSVSHWDQVLSLVRQGQEDEAVFTLVHVVQRLLSEKAPKRGASEKASVQYVDSLFQRVASGVQDNLHQCTSESLSRLNEKVAEVHQKIAGLRKFVQTELHDIELELAQLKRMKADPAADTDDATGNGDTFSYTIAHAHGNA